MWEAWGKVVTTKGLEVDILRRIALESTRIKQLGYTDQLLPDDPEGHEELTQRKKDQYVSERYKDDLKVFKEWRREGGNQNKAGESIVIL